MKSNIIALILLMLIQLELLRKVKSFLENNDAGFQWSNGCPKKAPKCPSSFKRHTPLVLMSLDGFRTVDLKSGFTPTLQKLSKCGVLAKYMQPVFPSKTFPNHFSLVTGLYPTSHGIIDNFFLDPIRKQKFAVGKKISRQPFWWEADPIWVSAEKQKKKTATFFWPGSDALINGTRPTYWREYSEETTFEARVDQALKWLDLRPSKRPTFIALHFNEPDNTSHMNGQKHRKTDESLTKVDRFIERFFFGLQERGLIDCVNVIITSDHGMTEVARNRSIDMRKYVNVNATEGFDGVFARINIKKGANTSLKNIEEALRCRDPHMKVFNKKLLPVRLHYSHHPRIEPIYVLMDNGWMIFRKPNKKQWDTLKGMHGYDNNFPEMMAFFMAIGPSVKKNTVVEPFINTEVYELLCELIEINPNPNNGTRGSLHHLLKSPRLPLSQQKEVKPPPTVKEPKFDNYNSGCTCSRTSFNRKVNVAASRAYHLPFGVPLSSVGNRRLILLHNADYVLAYHSKLKMASWVAFTLPRKANFSSEESNCFTADPRISRNISAKCTDYNSKFFKRNYIFQRPLYPPVFSKSAENKAAMYVTNSVPKSANHTILEKRMTKLLREWAAKKGPMNVIMGPAFDFQATGIKPKPNVINKMLRKGSHLIPTHIFLVITWCSENVVNFKKCKFTRLLTRSFLLPNWPYPKNCESTDATIKLNVARVVDVEMLTGLSLYRALPVYQNVRLRTSLPQE